MMTEAPVDLTDDWMNPRLRYWTLDVAAHREWQKERPYLITRAKRTICFGNPGSIVTWETWGRYKTAEERDAELAKIAKEHPMWQVRAEHEDPFAKYHAYGSAS